jgi:hypothetical protein
MSYFSFNALCTENKKYSTSIRSKFKIILFVFFLLAAHGAQAEEAMQNETDWSKGTSYLEYSTYRTILTHEFAHALTGVAFGAKHPNIELSWNGGVTSFENDFRPSTIGEHIIDLSGYITNRLNAAWVNQLLIRYDDVHTWPTKLGATFYFMNRFAIVYGWFQGFFKPDFALNDFSNHANLISNRDETRMAIKLMWGGLIAADLYLCRDDIQDNWQRFLGRASESRSPNTQFWILPNPYFLQAGFNHSW